MSQTPNDPLFQYQRFLNDTGQSGGGVGSDINVLPVWPQYTGRGVKVAIVDDGVQLDHPDLQDNIDTARSWDCVLNEPGGGPVNANENHGTAVAGLVAEIANNHIGGTGVAPDATLQAYRIDLHNLGVGDKATVIAFQKALQNQADVVNNSWGSDKAFTNNAKNQDESALFTAVNNLAIQGRSGKGSVVLFANGNAGAKGADGNLDNQLNNRYVIAVGAVDNNGVRSSYSTPGADLLVSAPGGASTGQSETQPGNGDLTTDRTGSDGYNTLADAAGNYAYNFNGTSAATPIVSGVVALMLQANPGLGYRDVQEILAFSARFVDPAASSWVTTNSGNWNGAGQMFSRDYGFGEVDAHAAVRLAESYKTLNLAARTDANVVNVEGSSSTSQLVDKYLQLKVTLGAGVSIEHVDLDLNALIADPSSLTVYLTSPSGTQIPMVVNPSNASDPWPNGGFSLGTDAFWGEQSDGTWTVSVSASGSMNSVYVEMTPGTFNASTDLAISVDATGTGVLRPSDFVF
jgi:subtilisin family serine protease